MFYALGFLFVRDLDAISGFASGTSVRLCMTSDSRTVPPGYRWTPFSREFCADLYVVPGRQ